VRQATVSSDAPAHSKGCVSHGARPAQPGGRRAQEAAAMSSAPPTPVTSDMIPGAARSSALSFAPAHLCGIQPVLGLMSRPGPVQAVGGCKLGRL